MSFSASNLATLAALANGIIPADERDRGAAEVDAAARLSQRLESNPALPLYLKGLSAAEELAQEKFNRQVGELNTTQMNELLARVQQQSPAFFKQLRMDVSALYLSDPAVWQRIGFPGPSTESGGYPDFDQPQTQRGETLHGHRRMVCKKCKRAFNL